MSIKSKKARSYADLLAAQVPRRADLLDGRLAVTITIYYRTQRPDLDASVILDGLQGRIYRNDRQVQEMHLYRFVDRDNPRAEVLITHAFGNGREWNEMP